MSNDIFPIDLTGKTAFVTGAASGIGRAVAVLYARAGAKVVCSDVRPDGLDEVVSTITSLGGVASSAVLDVSDRATVELAISNVGESWGGVDVLCNAAGIFIDVLPSRPSEADLDRVMDVNYKGTLYTCQAVVAQLRSRGVGGTIVNLTTGGLDKPLPTQFAYLASKAAVLELTRCLALDVGADHIRVNAIAAGYVDTPMIRRNAMDVDGTIDAEKWRQTREGYASLSPLGLVGEPDDIAMTALFLATEASRFYTGQTLRPNGGFVVPR
ncbi:SDR family NAD(P)-dependent oxidoreductase [Nocardioides sp. NPDC051685]|uniref:SDR family NAD(P)-dependent oxidoreductase n=1 Tax=Nocardioides sp. NPDC051685 TaxID=3364334 RepID=UPI0037896A18